MEKHAGNIMEYLSKVETAILSDEPVPSPMTQLGCGMVAAGTITAALLISIAIMGSLELLGIL